MTKSKMRELWFKGFTKRLELKREEELIKKWSKLVLEVGLFTIGIILVIKFV